MGIKHIYNDNLRKLPIEYGDVSVMEIGIHNSGKKHHSSNRGHESLASWLLDMIVQNLCFDILFNKKNDMEYFKI